LEGIQKVSFIMFLHLTLTPKGGLMMVKNLWLEYRSW